MTSHSLTLRAAAVVAAALLGGTLAAEVSGADEEARVDDPRQLAVANRVWSTPVQPRESPLLAPAVVARPGPVPTSLATRTRTSSRGVAPRPRPVLTAPRISQAGPGSPRLLRVPAIDLILPVQAEGVDPTGLMSLPDTVGAAGWYRHGPRPGSARGSTVIAGHVDTEEEGIGPMAGLEALVAGDQVVVESTRGRTTYDVISVATIAQQDLDLERLFARTGPPRLRLVTCGGAYLPDQGGYQSNVVVVAAPTASERLARS